MTTSTAPLPAPKLLQPDNGYFEVWECAHGHRYRVVTEYNQDLRRWNRPDLAPRMSEPVGTNIRNRTHESHAARHDA